MNASLRDLKRRADTLAPPSFDVEHIVERGDARLRRRRAALAAGAAGLVVAVIAAGTALTGSYQRSNEPVENPSPSVTETPAQATRQLTFTDDYADDFEQGQSPRWLIRSIHYGDRILRPGVDVMHMDVTDDGLALVAKDGAIYLADESSVERIGKMTIDVSWSDGGVMSSNAGSLLAWFTLVEPEASLVVYDTHEREILTRLSVPGCGPRDCSLEAVIGDRVYWSESDEPESEQVAGRPLKALDVPSGTVSETNLGELWDDLRAHPRGLIKGDSFADGEVVNEHVNQEAVYFVPDGSSLALRRFVHEAGPGDADDVYAFGGFDTTGRRLNLRLPDGYTPAATAYALFQWLDDDRFAVMAGATHNEFGWNGFPAYGDILVCNIAQERCTLAAKGRTDDGFRLVPHLDVPN
jgi:hypothetical protein